MRPPVMGGVSRQGSRIMMFISGPPTIGQGMVVKRNKTETIRSHTDLHKKLAPHYKGAVKARSCCNDEMSLTS